MGRHKPARHYRPLLADSNRSADCRIADRWRPQVYPMVRLQREERTAPPDQYRPAANGSSVTTGYRSSLQCREPDISVPRLPAKLTIAKQLGADDLGSSLIECPQRSFAGFARQRDVQAVSEVCRTLAV